MERTDRPSFWQSRAFLVFLVFAAMAVVLLWEEHRAHFLGALPYLFILACPLMHIFMHRGHGGRHGPALADPRGPGAHAHGADGQQGRLAAGHGKRSGRGHPGGPAAKDRAGGAARC